jgi:UMF1 family MFS transporter
VNRWQLAGWCAFDFANSSFTTIVVTVHFGPWFTQQLASSGRDAALSPDSTWALANAAGTLLSAVLATPLGALADERAWRKALLFATVFVCCTATALLAEANTLAPTLLLFTLALCAFLLSENAISSFLPSLAAPSELGRISGLGWAVGYAGGLLALLSVSSAAAAGDMPRVLRIAALFFAVAALPALLLLREPPRSTQRKESLWAWFTRERVRFQDTFAFLLALFAFQAGVAVVLTMAAVYAQAEVGLNAEDLTLLFLLLQGSAAMGSLGFGWLQDRLGLLRALSSSLVVWILAIVGCTASRDAHVFFVGATLAGLGMGATQSSGRAVIAFLAPPRREATWFGLWGCAGKGAALLGLLVFALLRCALDLRLSLACCALFFVAGLLLLARVDLRRGHVAANGTTGATA